MAEKDHKPSPTAKKTQSGISWKAIIAVLVSITGLIGAIVSWLDFVKHILESGYQIFLWAGFLFIFIIWCIMLWQLYQHRKSIGDNWFTGVLIIGLVAWTGCFYFLTGVINDQPIAVQQTQSPASSPTKQDQLDLSQPTSTSIPKPTQPPDLTNLYSFFPHPIMGSTRTYNYSVIPYYGENEKAVQTVEVTSGSYSETIKIVNDILFEKGVTIVGVETTANEEKINPLIQSPCPSNFFWYIYDAKRLYTICSSAYVYDAAYTVASNSEADLVIQGQFITEPLKLQPIYYAPFDSKKYWQANDYSISFAGKVSKETPLGTFNDCIKLRFFLVNYEEFRYLCPAVGLVAVEITSRGEYYQSVLVEIK